MDWTRTKRALISTLDILSYVAVIAVAAAIVWMLVGRRATGAEPSERPFALPSTPIDIGDAPTKGAPDAAFAMFIFSDFQCPSCRAFALETLPTIEREFVDTGKLLLVYRNLPLERIHDYAVAAAVAAACAGEQGRFWDMHDRWFRAQRDEFNDDGVNAAARVLGLDLTRFVACRSGSGIDRVKADAAAVRKLGITATPTFMIGKLRSNRTVIVSRSTAGAKSVKAFSDMLVQAMK